MKEKQCNNKKNGSKLEVSAELNPLNSSVKEKCKDGGGTCARDKGIDRMKK